MTDVKKRSLEKSPTAANVDVRTIFSCLPLFIVSEETNLAVVWSSMVSTKLFEVIFTERKLIAYVQSSRSCPSIQTYLIDKHLFSASVSNENRFS